MKNIFTFIIVLTATFSGFSQSYQFGIVHNADNNFSIVALPDFNATDTDISDVGFTLMLPTGDADLINITEFNGRIWTVNKLTATQLDTAGLGDGTRDAFVLNLPPGQTILSHSEDTSFVLLTFEISDLPTSGLLEILANSDPIAIGLSGAANSFYNSNIDNTSTQDYFASAIEGQESFLLETLDVKDFDFENQSLSIYPNPTTDLIHVSTNSEVLELKLYNILGKNVVLLKNTKSMTIEHLQSGTYFLHIKTHHGMITKKVIKK